MAIKQDTSPIVREHGRDAQDTGSTSVQVALVTSRITMLTQHCKEHPKDFSTRRGLLALVNQRRSLLKYLMRKSETQYRDLVQKLGLRR